MVKIGQMSWREIQRGGMEYKDGHNSRLVQVKGWLRWPTLDFGYQTLDISGPYNGELI